MAAGVALLMALTDPPVTVQIPECPKVEAAKPQGWVPPEGWEWRRLDKRFWDIDT